MTAWGDPTKWFIAKCKRGRPMWHVYDPRTEQLDGTDFCVEREFRTGEEAIAFVDSELRGMPGKIIDAIFREVPKLIDAVLHLNEKRCWICGDLATHNADEAPLGDGAELCDNCFLWESLK